MTKEELKLKNKSEVLDFIKKRLLLKTSNNNLIQEEIYACENLEIINIFADLGIYENTIFLVFDEKTLYLQYKRENKTHNIDISDLNTSEIIYKIFEKTIFL